MIRRARAYARLMRVSNAPTVVTNVMLGAALATDDYDARTLAFPVVAVLLIYLAGMILNDVFDASHDASHKPDRPIPSGAMGVREAFVAGMLLFVAGALLAWAASTTALLVTLALITCVLVYDAFHKASAWFSVVMGACRGLSYGVGFACFSTALTDPLLIAVALSSVAYIGLLTFVARREDDGSAGWRAKLSVLMPLTIAAPAVLIANEYFVSALAVVCLALFVLWMARSCRLLLRRSPNVRGAVTGWLSGICLFDASLLALNGNDTLAYAAFACFALTAIAHKFVPGT